MKLSRLITLLIVPFVLASCETSGTSTSTTSTSTTSTSDVPHSRDTSTTDTEEPGPLDPVEITKEIASYLYTYQKGEGVDTFNFEGLGEIPYVRPEKFLNALFETVGYQNVTFRFSNLGDGVYKIYLKGYENSEYFLIDTANETIQIGNDAMDMFNSLSTTSGTRNFINGYHTNYIKFDNSRSKIHINKQYPTYNLAKYNMNLVNDKDGLVYVPFHILNDIFLQPTGYAFSFNGKHYFLNAYLGTNYQPDEFISTSTMYNKSTRTASYAKYTYNEYLFFVENIYGLAKERGFNGNFDTILKNAGYKNDLLSTNTSTYERAMAEATAEIFYDGHSGYLQPSLYVLNNSSTYTNYYSAKLETNTREMSLMNTYNTLRGYRYNAGKSTKYYETYDDTAFIRFDGFNMTSQDISNINVDKYDYSTLHNADSILLFLKAFKAIKADVNIKNVIVDIGMNGGGAADTLPWLQAFFTANPSCTFMYDQTGETFETFYNVDLNFDGVYDENDTYAGKYNFYLLTSGFSFSCGSAFPTFVKHNKSMTILGKRSGGGECVVSSYVNAAGTLLRNSGNYHIGTYVPSNQSFDGDDDGIPVDYEIDYEYFYNLNYLTNFIHNLQD